MNSSVYFPPEWCEQQAVLCTWPDEQTDWVDCLPLIEPVYRDLVSQAAQFQPVYVNCRDASHQTHIEAILSNTPPNAYPIIFCQLPYEDTWIRDYGPLTIFHNQQIQWLDFRFNAWGGKFPTYHDDAATQRIHALHFSKINLTTLPIVLEGGAIETDGEGTLLTTPCIFTKTRNPNMSHAEMELLLRKNFGVHRIWVIENGYLEGDDTDGHIDMLARFCNPNTIAYTACDDPHDVHYDALKKMEAELALGVTSDGAPYELIALPIPAAMFDEDGSRLPASYANFLIINGAVLVPIYDDPNDEIALSRLRTVFPSRQVIGIYSLPLLHQHGSLHCATMQVPAAGLGLRN